jgi:hypothetical protein
MSCLLWSAGSSEAIESWGPRAGLSGDPDQFLIGAQFNAGNIWRNTRIAPNVQAGVGDDIFTLGGAAAMHYVFRQGRGGWGPYAGGELGLLYSDPDGNRFRGDRDTDLAVSAAGGLETRLADGGRLNFELRVGFVDAQDVQLHVGRTF